MKVNKLAAIFLGILVIVGFLVSCNPQTSQVQPSPSSSTASHETLTPTPQKAVWGNNLVLTVLDTNWKGNTLTLRINLENRGNETTTFNQVFYAYDDSGTSTKMCQSQLQNLWATYLVGDSRSETIYFVLPPSSSDIWLAIEAVKIIRIPRQIVPQVFETKVSGLFSYTLKSVEWSGNRVAITLSIKNYSSTPHTISLAPTLNDTWFLISNSIPPIGTKHDWETSWYIGKYEPDDVRNGTIYFDIPPCAINLTFGRGSDLQFAIYR
jgi:hypothetical protein